MVFESVIAKALAEAPNFSIYLIDQVLFINSTDLEVG